MKGANAWIARGEGSAGGMMWVVEGGRERDSVAPTSGSGTVRGVPGKEDSEGVLCVLWVFWKNTCAVPLKKLREQPV